MRLSIQNLIGPKTRIMSLAPIFTIPNKLSGMISGKLGLNKIIT